MSEIHHYVYLEIVTKGEVAERLKAHAWKACIGETLSWVRIPFSPPQIIFILCGQFDIFCLLVKLLNEQFNVKNDIINFSIK